MSRLFASIVLLLAAACGGETPATFSEVQSAVFTPSCAFSSCHSGTNPQAGLDLTASSYSRIVGVAAMGESDETLVVAGDPEASYLLKKLEARDIQVGDTMPPGGQTLSEERIALVRSWIAAGAPND